MILITGGLGFIGLHTARSLLDQGEECVLTQYRVAREPDFIKDEIGKRVFVEQLDVTDRDRLMEIGKKHKITGIVHLAVPGLGALSPLDDYKVNMVGLMNILEAASAWEVKRIGLASSIGVYAAAQGPFVEDMPLRIGGRATEAFKKAFEILGGNYAQSTGLDAVMLRIGGIYGPLYHSMANLPSRLVHAAKAGTAPDMRGAEVFAEDGNDLCYVKDCGAGIAALQTAPKLNHAVYNVATGHMTTNGELAEAVRKVFPNAQLPIKEGQGPQYRANSYQDITRIKADTGYEPRFPVDKAIVDYADWLKSNPE